MAVQPGLLSTTGVLLPSNQAQAFDWRDLWQTKDQQAAEAFANEEHELAAALFESSEWSGAANYRSKNYESAIAAFSAINTPDGHYNRGNSLALAGNYPEAIAAYDAALSMAPDHADALNNEAIIEELLEQQESEEGEQEGDSQENQSEQNSQMSLSKRKTPNNKINRAKKGIRISKTTTESAQKNKKAQSLTAQNTLQLPMRIRRAAVARTMAPPH